MAEETEKLVAPGVDFDRLYFIASLVDASLDDQGERKEKHVRLVPMLKDFLNQYVRGDKQAFEDGAKYEAKLLSAAFGVKMLNNVGNIYTQYAQKLEKTAKKPEEKSTDRGKNIERTFSEVCQKVLSDEDVKKPDSNYPEALRKLGDIFLGKLQLSPDSSNVAGEVSTNSTEEELSPNNADEGSSSASGTGKKQSGFLQAVTKSGQVVMEHFRKEAKKGFDINQE